MRMPAQTNAINTAAPTGTIQRPLFAGTVIALDDGPAGAATTLALEIGIAVPEAGVGAANGTPLLLTGDGGGSSAASTCRARCG